MKPVYTDQNRAEAVALLALGYIIAETHLRESFLTASGLEPSGLAQLAADRGFLAGVLEFLLADEAALLAFCEACHIKPAEPAMARALLPGGSAPEWT